MQKQAAAAGEGKRFDLSAIVENRHYYEMVIPRVTAFRLWQRGISYQEQGYPSPLPGWLIADHLYLEELAAQYGNAKRSPKNNGGRK